MPIYEYKCNKCGILMDKFQSVNEPAPTCCGEPMERKFSPFSFTFGWVLSDKSLNDLTPGTKDEWVKNV